MEALLVAGCWLFGVVGILHIGTNNHQGTTTNQRSAKLPAGGGGRVGQFSTVPGSSEVVSTFVTNTVDSFFMSLWM